MGLLRRLVTLPAAPVEGMWWVIDQVVKEAERQYYGDGTTSDTFAELDAARDAGLVSEAEYAAAQDALVDRFMSDPRRHPVGGTPHQTMNDQTPGGGQ